MLGIHLKFIALPNLRWTETLIIYTNKNKFVDKYNYEFTIIAISSSHVNRIIHSKNLTAQFSAISFVFDSKASPFRLYVYSGFVLVVVSHLAISGRASTFNNFVPHSTYYLYFLIFNSQFFSLGPELFLYECILFIEHEYKICGFNLT